MPSASFKSVVEMFHHRIRSTPDTEAIHYRRDGTWHVMNWKEVGTRARAIACGLRALGLATEQRVAILSSTRAEWILADMGILCGGGATTTLYPSNTAEESAYILQDSNSHFVFVENQKQADKLSAVRDQIPEVKHLILIDGVGSADGWILPLSHLEKQGQDWESQNPGEYDRVADAVGPDHLATLIYTSGTTGKPKGVMLTHDNWVYEGEAVDAMGMITPSDKQFLFLPLAHSFAKVLEIAFIRIGTPTAVDGDIDSLLENLGAQQPTYMGAVPRIFEKVYNKVVSSAHEAGGLKLRIFTWAMGVGRQVSQLRQRKQEPTGLLALKYSLADKLVFSKLKERFGGRIRFFISGGAPLSREIAEFFHAADILVLEGYGLTESSAGTFMNRYDDYRFGTVGAPVVNTQVRIADDGEILIKGRGIMKGYYNRPEDTAAALDPDGWLHTGDIGMVQDGFLKITDRKKDLIKTSGGKYVAPQEIENKVKSRSPLVSQVLVHGDNRNFCSALIAVSEDTGKSWLAQQGITVSSYADLVAHPKIEEELGRVMESVNLELASYESIKKFAILPKDLTLDDGDLTPKMSVKRKVVEGKYKHLLDKFYEGTLQAL